MQHIHCTRVQFYNTIISILNEIQETKEEFSREKDSLTMKRVDAGPQGLCWQEREAMFYLGPSCVFVVLTRLQSPV